MEAITRGRPTVPRGVPGSEAQFRFEVVVNKECHRSKHKKQSSLHTARECSVPLVVLCCAPSVYAYASQAKLCTEP